MAGLVSQRVDLKLVRDLPIENWKSRKFLQSNSPTSRKSA